MIKNLTKILIIEIQDIFIYVYILMQKIFFLS